MASGELVPCKNCRWSREEAKVTRVTYTGDEVRRSMVIEYLLVCRAPKYSLVKINDEEIPAQSPNRGQEVADDYYCLVSQRKPRHKG